MAYLEIEDIATHIRDEIILVIDDSEERGKLQFAIDAAIEEVGSYLGAYDIAAIFEAEGGERNPIILLYTKDVAVWHFIQLANPNIDMAMRERRYELASSFLSEVQKGKRVLNLPVPEPSAEDPQKNNEVRYGSSRPRNNGFL